MKIMSVRVNDKFFDLIPTSAEKYGKLFDIDSVSLILGTNGSGKTRMLVSLANAINSPRDDSFQFYMLETPNGEIEPEGPYYKYMCSIYYSALPYRRKLNRRKGIYNASPKHAFSTDNKRIEKFGMISNILNIDTRLEGVVKYTKTVFRTILIPNIRDSVILDSPDLKYLIDRLYGSDSMGKSYGSMKKSTYDEDRERERTLGRIEEFLEQVFFKKFRYLTGFLIFSVLEFFYETEGRDGVDNMAITLLGDLGVIKKASFSGDNKYIKKLWYYVNNTNEILDEYKDESYKIDRRTLKFMLNDITDTNIIKSKDTAIHIEWSNQSSGLQALVEQFSLIDESICKARESGYKSILLLIDEGDAYLHLDWQRRYISLLNKFLGDVKSKYSLDSLQLVLATHSPLLAADIPGDFVTSLDSGKFSQTFAAPIEEIITSAFSSSSLGEFAAHKINEIYRRLQSNELTSYDRRLIDSIGDVTIKAVLEKELSK